MKDDVTKACGCGIEYAYNGGCRCNPCSCKPCNC